MTIEHFVPDDPCYLVERPIVGRHRDAVPFALGFEHYKGQEVLRSDRTLHFALQHELERVRLQQA